MGLLSRCGSRVYYVQLSEGHFVGSISSHYVTVDGSGDLCFEEALSVVPTAFLEYVNGGALSHRLRPVKER